MGKSIQGLKIMIIISFSVNRLFKREDVKEKREKNVNKFRNFRLNICNNISENVECSAMLLPETGDSIKQFNGPNIDKH